MPSISSLRKFNFYDAFEREVDGKPRPWELAAILDQFWPECSEGVRGNAIMSPDDAARMEQLFELFGVPMKVLENSVQVVGHAYDVFGQALASFVNQKLRHPDEFHRFVHDWPDDWREYIEAVAAQDREAARAFAVKLQPLSPNCIFPPGVRVPHPDELAHLRTGE